MSKALRDKLPKGSSRNKIEALADIVDLMPKGNFKPVSMVLEPKRFDEYPGARKDSFRLVACSSLSSATNTGPFEFTENNGVSLYQFTKAYEVDLQSWDEPEGLPTVNFPEMPDVMMPDVIAFQVNVTFELIIDNLPSEFIDVDKLKGLKLTVFLNYGTEAHERESTEVAVIPATLIKQKYGGIIISGSANSAFTLDKPMTEQENERYLSCWLDWSDTDFSFQDYSNEIMWKDNAFELTRSIGGNQLGVRVSLLDMHVAKPVLGLSPVPE